MAKLDELVLDKNELSLPAGRHTSHPRSRQAHKIGVYLTSDQDVRIAGAKVTDQARQRTCRPLGTEAVNAFQETKDEYAT